MRLDVGEMAMRIARLHAYGEDPQSVVKRIVQDLEEFHTYDGKLSVKRVLPSRGLPAGDPAGDPYLVVEEEKCDKLLGLIPYSRRNHATHVVYWSRNRFRPRYTVSL